MDAVDSLSSRSCPASVSVRAEYRDFSICCSPYAASVASMLRWMKGLSVSTAFGSTWKRCTMAG